MSTMKRFLMVLILLCAAVIAEAAEKDDIAVIVNSKFPSESLSMDDVREIYRSKLQFISGTRMKPVDQKDDQEIRSVFLDEVMHWSKTDYTKYWMHLVFLEGAIPPVKRDDSLAVIRTVGETEGGIGYVWARDIPGSSGVKTVLTLHRSKGK